MTGTWMRMLMAEASILREMLSSFYGESASARITYFNPNHERLSANANQRSADSYGKTWTDVGISHIYRVTLIFIIN